jgi:hypothetical protein
VHSAQWLACPSESETDLPSPSTTSSTEASGSGSASKFASSLFLEAWLQARAHLREAYSIRSFKVIHAIFMFDMTVIPVEACSHLV